MGVPGTGLKTCTQKNLTTARLTDTIRNNLWALARMVDYNCKNGIKLFRISSDLIPFGSSPLNTVPWREQFAPELSAIGEKIRQHDMRVSMHPGQYTVLNALDGDVVRRAVADLQYHDSVLTGLGVGQPHKIILHVGGVYGDKKEAMARFATVYKQLDDGIKKRLVIENDDKSYMIADVLVLGTALGIPVVYDNLHNEVNPADREKTDDYWVAACRGTWGAEDGPQKIHYSQQDPGKKQGSHSSTIGAREFMAFYEGLREPWPDIMLEVKDKNLSAVKCIVCTDPGGRIRALEQEWSRYKYKVLENAPALYNRIRQLLRDKAAYPALAFYELVEEALQREPTVGDMVNAALHVWGYFKDRAEEREKRLFLRRLEALKTGSGSIAAVKKCLWTLTEKYDERYLLESLYFFI